MASSLKPLVLDGGLIRELASAENLNASVTGVNDITQLTNSSGGTINEAMPVYISGAGAISKAQANADGTSKVVGLAFEDISNSSSGNVLLDGILSLSDWTSVLGATNLVTGTEYYLSAATAGQITATAPSTGGQHVVKIGTAINTTDLELSIRHVAKLSA